jgi:hypothetical protein
MKAKASNPCALVIYARNELLMLWPVILPWRQKNIRDCKVIGVDSNLFKAPIGPFSMATQPSWVTKQDRVSPGTSLWQIRFGAYETKTKIEVHAFLPYELVPLLEEYLSIHRRVLIGKSEDPVRCLSTMQMNVGQVRNLLKKLASAHAGVPVTWLP